MSYINLDSPLAPILFPLIAAIVIGIVGHGSLTFRRWLSVLALIANLLVALRWLAPGAPRSLSLNATTLGGQLWSFTFRVDALGGLLLVLVATTTLVIAIAATAHAGRRATVDGTVPLLLALASANGALTAADLLTLYAAALLTSAFLLVYSSHCGITAGQATFRLLGSIEVTGLAILLVIVLAVASHAPSTPISLAGVGAVGPFVLLAIVVRLGLVPMHQPGFTTLEKSSGSSGVTVYLIAATVGVNILLRLFGAMGAADLPSSEVLLTLGIATVLVASFAVLRQRNLKQAIAALTITQLGLVAIGLAGDRAIGFEAAIAELLCVVLLAPLPFLALEHLLQDTDGDTDQPLRLAFARRPFAGMLLAASLLAIAGLPPSYGFLARGYVLQSLLTAGGAGSLIGILAVLIATGAAFAATAKIIAVSFPTPEDVKLTGWWLGTRTSAISLGIAAVPLLVCSAAPFALHRWLVGPALSAASGAPSPLAGVTGGTVVASILLLVSLAVGGWLFISPSNLPPTLEARLRSIADTIERLASGGYLDPHTLVAVVFGAIAKLIAIALGRVLDRLAI